MKLSFVIGECRCQCGNAALSLYSIQFSLSKLTGITLYQLIHILDILCISNTEVDPHG